MSYCVSSSTVGSFAERFEGLVIQASSVIPSRTGIMRLMSMSYPGPTSAAPAKAAASMTAGMARNTPRVLRAFVLLVVVPWRIARMALIIVLTPKAKQHAAHADVIFGKPRSPYPGHQAISHTRRIFVVTGQAFA